MNISDVNLRLKNITIDRFFKYIDKNNIKMGVSTYDDIDASRLIESIIINFPMRVFFMSNVGIMKGSRRLQTIKHFLDNKFPLYYLGILENLNGKYYSELEDYYKDSILNRNLQVYHLDTNNEEVIYDVYRRIERGGW